MIIYTFNNQSNIFFYIMKNYFKINEENFYDTINLGFDSLQEQLKLKNIDYTDLKGALIPNQDKNKDEICFIFDSSKIDAFDYGYYIFNKLIPILDKESTYSILCGDYVDIFRDENSQKYLFMILKDVLNVFNKSNYEDSNQYYLIYFNRLSKNQQLNIINHLKPFSWFVGYANITHNSMFKTYISNILVSVGIKNKNKMIMYHSLDYADNENVNLRGYPFEENNFLIL